MSETLELKHGNFEGWAIVEMMGHRKEIGFVTTEAFGGAVLFRVDQPEMPEGRETTLTYMRQIGGDWFPAGTRIREGVLPARTVYVAPNSLYALNPCTEDAARKAIDVNMPRPIVLLEVPRCPEISAANGESGNADSAGMELLDGEDDDEGRPF